MLDQVYAAGQYLAHRMRPGTGEFYMAVTPVAVYWLISLFYEVLDRSSHPFIVKHRITRKDRGRENSVGKVDVALRVLLQHVLQTLLAMAVMLVDREECSVRPAARNPLHAFVQLAIGMVVMDAWQYWIHRLMHVNTFLYKHVHSTHHQLWLPYAYGALYNNPIEALILDTVGAGISMYAAGMGCSLASAFFGFSTAKTVLDHCNYRFPLNPLHDVFPNSAAYHDVHHDHRGIKKNFSQPFFTFWDHLCGTYLDPAGFHFTPAELAKKVDADVAAAAAKSPSKQAAAGSPAKPAAAAANGHAQPDGGDASPTTSQGSGDQQQQQQDEVKTPSVRRRASAAAAAAAATPSIGAASVPRTGVTTRSRARAAAASGSGSEL